MISIFPLQIVNKGGLTIKEDQCTESERVQTRNWPEFSGKPENEHVLYDFSDEQVGAYFSCILIAF